MRRLSPYASASRPKRGKKLACLLIDLLSCFALTLILFFAVDAIVTSSGGLDSISQNLVKSEAKTISLIEESGLNQANEYGEMRSNEEVANSFVLSLTYSSLLNGGKSEGEISKKTYSGTKKIEEGGDPLYSYYCSFKPNHLSEYLGEGISDYGLSFYRGKLEENHGQIFVEEGYPYLRLEEAAKIDEGYRNPSFTEGVSLRNEIKGNYETLLKEAIGEYKASFSPYAEARKAYEESYQDLLKAKILECFGGYLLSCAILYFVLPLILKQGRSISMSVFKLAYRDSKAKEPSFWQITLHFLIIFLEFIGIVPIGLLLAYGSNAVTLLSLPLFAGVPLFTFLIYSFLVVLISYLLSFFKKKQTLSEIVSLLELCNKEE